jgi:hypothetical protein
MNTKIEEAAEARFPRLKYGDDMFEAYIDGANDTLRMVLDEIVKMPTDLETDGYHRMIYLHIQSLIVTN